MFAAQVANLELTRDDGRELAGNRSESCPVDFSAGSERFATSAEHN